MQIKFLCEKHADWVYSHPEHALHVMARDEMQGSLMMHSGQYNNAVPYLGCAYDIAVILLEVDGGENTAMAHKIKCISAMLEEIYYYLRLPQHRNAIVDRTHTVIDASSSAVNHSKSITFRV